MPLSSSKGKERRNKNKNAILVHKFTLYTSLSNKKQAFLVKRGLWPLLGKLLKFVNVNKIRAL